MKRIVALLLVLCMAVGLAACGQKAPAPTEAPAAPAASGETAPAATEAVPEENLTETQKIIKEAQTMTLEELAKKAIEESNGKMFYGVATPAAARAHCPCSLPICRPSTPAIIWSSSGSSPKTTRSSIS